MKSLEPFKSFVEYKGIHLEAMVTHCSISGLWLELISPYSGIKSGFHMPYYALTFETSWNIDLENNLTEKGRKLIEQAMIEAYEKADYLFRNRETLYERFKEFDKDVITEIDALNMLKSSAISVKKDLKTKFKQGIIKASEYTTSIKLYKTKINQTESAIRDQKRSLFSGFNLKSGDEDQCIEFVKKYFSEQ